MLIWSDEKMYYMGCENGYRGAPYIQFSQGNTSVFHYYEMVTTNGVKSWVLRSDGSPETIGTKKRQYCMSTGNFFYGNVTDVDGKVYVPSNYNENFSISEIREIPKYLTTAEVQAICGSNKTNCVANGAYYTMFQQKENNKIHLYLTDIPLRYRADSEKWFTCPYSMGYQEYVLDLDTKTWYFVGSNWYTTDININYGTDASYYTILNYNYDLLDLKGNKIETQKPYVYIPPPVPTISNNLWDDDVYEQMAKIFTSMNYDIPTILLLFSTIMLFVYFMVRMIGGFFKWAKSILP
jgi:hypothetical protein